MRKTIWQHGLIGGGIASIWLAIVTWMGTQQQLPGQSGAWFGYLFMLFGYTMVWLGVRKYRDQHMGGVINFGDAFKTGIFITLIIASVYVLVWEVAYFAIVPDFMELYTEQYLEALKAGGATKETIMKEAHSMEQLNVQYKNPLFNMGATYLEVLPIGVVVTIISALVLKKKA